MRGHIIFDWIVEKRCRALSGSAGLARSGAVTSMMDTNDGFAMSLHDLVDVSGVGFEVYEDALPIADEVRVFAGNADSALELALYTDGDFGLLFTVRSNMIVAARGVCDFSVIGNVVGKDDGVMVELASGSVECVNRKGYEQLAIINNKNFLMKNIGR